jgi:uncharacterized membrane protein YccC
MSRIEESVTVVNPVPLPETGRLADVTRSVGSALLFGLRLWVAVCLALYVAFWLELDNAYWAGTSAAVVSLPSLGASVRKATFRMIGTVVGAVAILALTACFPQDRAAFILGLALWGAICGFGATILQNFASYGAAMAGVTAAIIAFDELGATGGPNGHAFMFAVTRATEICIGIVCSSVVLAGTDFGRARRRLFDQIVALASEIGTGLIAAFSFSGLEVIETQAIRRDLTRRVVDLGPLIDEAIGESSDLYFRRHMLEHAIDGLYAALAGWRAVAIELEGKSSELARREAGIILETVPLELRSATKQQSATLWNTSNSHVRRTVREAVRALIRLRGRTPSLQLLSDNTAEALLGICRTLDGLVLLTDPGRVVVRFGAHRLLVPDLLPALISSVRVFVTIIAVALFWIATGWPNGAAAMTFALVTVTVALSRGDQAYAGALSVLLGTGMSAALAAIIKFAVLPGTVTFLGFCLVIGLVLVPIGALELWNGPIFLSAGTYFIPLLAPANPANYNLEQFFNLALAILAGVGAGVLAFLLLPALSPALRARRLLALTLRDLRRLATGQIPSTSADWESRIYNRLSALPDQAPLLQNARLVTALTVGTEVIRLSRLLRRVDDRLSLEGGLRTLARGNIMSTVKHLAEVDRAIAASTTASPVASVGFRARASIRIISEGLTQHADYFDGRALG